MPPMGKMGVANEVAVKRVERSNDESPKTFLDSSLWRHTIGRKRNKRDCGCCCGSGSGEGRRRRRNRKRARANRLALSLLNFISNDTQTRSDEQFPPQRIDSSTPTAPILIILENSTKIGSNEEIESAEIIIISPDSGSADDSSADVSSTDSSPENMVLPYVGTYGNKKALPGAECQKDIDCVIGAVCKKVSNTGHCVCEPPLVNLGNGCVPRARNGPK